MKFDDDFVGEGKGGGVEGQVGGGEVGGGQVCGCGDGGHCGLRGSASFLL